MVALIRHRHSERQQLRITWADKDHLRLVQIEVSHDLRTAAMQLALLHLGKGLQEVLHVDWPQCCCHLTQLALLFLILFGSQVPQAIHGAGPAQLTEVAAGPALCQAGQPVVVHILADVFNE